MISKRIDLINMSVTKLNKTFSKVTLSLQESEALKNFSEQTHLHGFRELSETNKVVYKIFWFIVILTAVGLTVYQVALATCQFYAQPTVTTLETLKQNQILYPPLKLCYQHWTQWVDWDQTASMNLTKNLFLFGLSYLDKIFTDTRINESEAEVEFISLMFKYNWTNVKEFYFKIALKYPRSLVSMIPYFSKSTDDWRLEFEWKNEFPILLCYAIAGEKLLEILNNISRNDMIFRKYYSKEIALKFKKQTAIKFNEFLSPNEYKEYVKYVWQFQNLSIDFESSKSGGYNFALPIVLSSHDECSFFLSPDVDYYKVQLIAKVNVWKSNLGKSMPCSPSLKTISNENKCLMTCGAKFAKNYSKLRFFVAVISNDDTLQQICRYQIAQINSNVSTNFESNFFTLHITSKYKKATDFEENFLKNLPTDCVGNFTLRKYRRYLVKHCPEQCLPGCEQWSYDTSLATFNYPISLSEFTKKSYTFVTLKYPTEESIFVITEIDSQNWETFVGNVGGVLGIWTGASLLTFIQMFYLCCNSCNFCTKRQYQIDNFKM